MELAFLCNNRLAFPTLQGLLEKKLVGAIGISDMHKDVIQIFGQLAEKYNIPIRIFSRKGFGTHLREWLTAFSPDAVVVMTFPFRIPTTALTIPQLGFINIHFGLLPEMRGADPIFETVRLRKPLAGTTVHVMDENYDTGPIILREEIQNMPHFTYGMLSAQLAMQGAKLCNQLVDILQRGNGIPSAPQDATKACYYPALTAPDLTLKWATAESADLIALIHSFNPVAKTGVPAQLNGWTFGICDASLVNLSGDTSAYQPGVILVIDPQNGLLVLTKDNVALKLEVVYTEEGYFPGYKLANFGIAAGMKFN